MKFRSDLITGLFNNEGDRVGKIMRLIDHREQIILAQGFGIQESPLPLRVLSYLVGSMKLLYQMPKTAMMELYIAKEGVLRANLYAREIITTRSEELQEIVRWYINERHPELAKQVRVLVDRTIQPESDLDHYFRSLLPMGLAIARENSSIGNFIEKRGGERALRYMLEHALYMRDPLAGSERYTGALVEDCVVDMDHVIMLGGPPEKVFYIFRQALLEKIGTHSRWHSHQIFVRAGDPPTYHSQTGEPGWGDASLSSSVMTMLYTTAVTVDQRNGVGNGVLRDLITLFADMGEIADFSLLQGVERLIRSRNPISSEVTRRLQDGWDRLRQAESIARTDS